MLMEGLAGIWQGRAALGSSERVNSAVGAGRLYGRRFLREFGQMIAEGLDLIVRDRRERLTLLLEDNSIHVLQGARNAAKGREVILPFGIDGLARNLHRIGLKSSQVNYETEILYSSMSGQVLIREVTLPAEARSHLSDIIRYQISRLTPYKADEVLFDFVLMDDHRADDEIEVQLCVMPKASAERLNAQVRRAGLSLSAIGVWDDERRKTFPVNLLRFHRFEKPRRDYRVRVGQFFVLAHLVAVPLLIGLTGLAFTLNRFTLEYKLGDAQSDAQEVAQLRGSIQNVARAATQLQLVKNSRLPVIMTVERLATMLPDGTWLERLEISGDEIRLQGLSRDASAVLRLLDQAPEFTDVAFLAPVVSRSEQQRFQIEARFTSQGGTNGS